MVFSSPAKRKESFLEIPDAEKPVAAHGSWRGGCGGRGAPRWGTCAFGCEVDESRRTGIWGLIAELTMRVRLWKGVSLWVSVSANIEALRGGLNVLLDSSL